MRLNAVLDVQWVWVAQSDFAVRVASAQISLMQPQNGAARAAAEWLQTDKIWLDADSFELLFEHLTNFDSVIVAKSKSINSSWCPPNMMRLGASCSMHSIFVILAERCVNFGMPRRNWCRSVVGVNANMPASTVNMSRTISLACTWKEVYFCMPGPKYDVTWPWLAGLDNGVKMGQNDSQLKGQCGQHSPLHCPSRAVLRGCRTTPWTHRMCLRHRPTPCPVPNTLAHFRQCWMCRNCLASNGRWYCDCRTLENIISSLWMSHSVVNACQNAGQSANLLVRVRMSSVRAVASPPQYT